MSAARLKVSAAAAAAAARDTFLRRRLPLRFHKREEPSGVGNDLRVNPAKTVTSLLLP